MCFINCLSVKIRSNRPHGLPERPQPASEELSLALTEAAAATFQIQENPHSPFHRLSQRTPSIPVPLPALCQTGLPTSQEQGSSPPAGAGKQEAAPTLPGGGADKLPFLGGHLSRPSTLWMREKHWPLAHRPATPHPGLLRTLSQGGGVSGPVDRGCRTVLLGALLTCQARSPFSAQVGRGLSSPATWVLLVPF